MSPSKIAFTVILYLYSFGLASQSLTPQDSVVFLNEAAAALSRTKPDSSIFLAAKSKALCAQYELWNEEVIARLVEVSALYVKAEYEQALESTAIALKKAKKLSFDEGIYKAYRHMGTIYTATNQLDSAVVVILKNIEFAKANGTKKQIAPLHIDIANVYRDMRDFSNAEKYYQLFFDEFGEIADDSNKARALFGYGMSKLIAGKKKEALPYFEMSSVIYEKLGDTRGLAEVNMLKGVTFYFENEHQKSIKYLKETIRAHKQLQNEVMLIDPHNYMAQNYRLMAQYQDALLHLDSAIMIGKETKRWRQLAYSFTIKSSILEKQGKYQSALTVYKEMSVVEDSMNLRNKEREVKALLAQFDTERQRVQIANLQKENENQVKTKLAIIIGGIVFLTLSVLLLVQNQRLKKTNERLEQSELDLQATLEEKEMLLKEIHHRVKNNLQVISSLLAVQSQEQEHPIINEFVQNGRARVQAMALVHQFLYQSDQSAFISYDGYLNQLTSTIVDFYDVKDRIDYTVQADNIKLDIDTSIPLGLIANEIITNSIKHGFPGNGMGHIDVGLKQSDKKVQFVVSDNGTGIHTESLGKKNGFGMNLIRNMVKSIKGHLEIENIGGTKFTLTFTNE